MKVPLYTKVAGKSSRLSTSNKERTVVKKKRRTRKNARRGRARKTRRAVRRNIPVPRRKRRNPRPRLRKKRGRWYASGRDPLKLRGKRINPRRKRRRRAVRRNPKVNVKTIQRFVTEALPYGIGMGIGFIGMPIVYRVLPASVTSGVNFPRWRGLIHVGLGSLIFIFGKGKTSRTVGLVVGGTGLYDVLAQNVPDLGLPGLPSANPLIDKAGASESTGRYYGLSYDAGRKPMGMSYEAPMGLSYAAQPGTLMTAGLNGDDYSDNIC